MKRLLLALTLAVASTLPARAGDSVLATRDALAKRVAVILGPTTNAEVTPIVSAAQLRLATAAQAATSGLRTPQQILDGPQKRAIFIARLMHTTPGLALRPEQREALITYAKAVARAVAPIVGDAGAQIDDLLSPDQRSSLVQVRDDGRARLSAAAAAVDEPLIATFLADVRPTSVGDFIVLVELDPQTLVGALR